MNHRMQVLGRVLGGVGSRVGVGVVAVSVVLASAGGTASAGVVSDDSRNGVLLSESDHSGMTWGGKQPIGTGSAEYDSGRDDDVDGNDGGPIKVHTDVPDLPPDGDGDGDKGQDAELTSGFDGGGDPGGSGGAVVLPGDVVDLLGDVLGGEADSASVLTGLAFDGGVSGVDVAVVAVPGVATIGEVGVADGLGTLPVRVVPAPGVSGLLVVSGLALVARRRRV